LWNALRLVKMWEGRISNSVDSNSNQFAIQWFEERLAQVNNELETLYKDFRLSEALKTIYSLIWDDFCSWYLEWVKPGFEQAIDPKTYNKTVSFFEELIQLLHPFMPFITEEIYHSLKERNAGDDLTIRQQSSLKSNDNTILLQGQLLKDVITGIRDTRNKQQIKPKEQIELSVLTLNPEVYEPINSILSKQVNASAINFVKETVAGSISAVIGKDKFYLVAEQPIDKGSQREELLKELHYQQGFLQSVDKKLSNERFVSNAKAEVVDLEKRKKADAEAKILAIKESLAGLG
ncbi:MAG: class I tRNA ligase family protein, partial [Chitinophagaceae bacterium]|nr:class I tRNA ligase family protein [Chitinophagaceae bacterium]